MDERRLIVNDFRQDETEAGPNPKTRACLFFWPDSTPKPMPGHVFDPHSKTFYIAPSRSPDISYFGECHVPSKACITELSTPDYSKCQGAQLMPCAAPHQPDPLHRLVAPRSGKNRLCLIPTPFGARAYHELARIDWLVRLSASGVSPAGAPPKFKVAPPAMLLQTLCDLASDQSSIPTRYDFFSDLETISRLAPHPSGAAFA